MYFHACGCAIMVECSLSGFDGNPQLYVDMGDRLVEERRLHRGVFERDALSWSCDKQRISRCRMSTYANNTSVKVFLHSAETYYVRTVENLRVEAHADAVVAASRTR